MIKSLIGFTTAISAFFPNIAIAQNRQGYEVLSTAPSELRSDTAYVLVRTSRFEEATPILMRIPTTSDLDAYRTAKAKSFANDLPTLAKKNLESGKPTEITIDSYPFNYRKIRNMYLWNAKEYIDQNEAFRTYLVAVPPAIYVLYATTDRAYLLSTCFCLGSVSFEAEAGKIIDLGTLLLADSSEKTDIAELKDETDLGRALGWIPATAAAIRQSADANPKPVSLNGFDVKPADFRAVGPYLDPTAASVNRLAPIEGVLKYRRGNVVDVKSGRELKPGETPR